MLHKTFDAIDVKADGDTGEFTATVAAFGNVDLVGDRILPGAFSKTLEEWRMSGDPIPVILSHQHENPMAHVGVTYAKDVQETAKGLFVKGTLDIGDNEVARQVHKLMKRRSLKEFSFGYKVPKGGEKRAKDGANDLSEIDLFEVGPTLKGANPDTELHAVKSALSKQADSGPDAADSQEMMADPAHLLATIYGLMQTFIDAEDDPADVAAMQDLADGLRDLMDTEESEDDTQDDASGKAVWTAAYINTLPDSSFLYVESGGSKDSEGKTTPRSLRHFPYKNANGSVDLPHVRNALARIPQSNLPQSVKDTATAKAQRILAANSKSAVEDARDEDRHAGKSRAQDLLRRRSDAAVLEIQSGGMSLRKPPKAQEPVKAEPLDEATLKRRSRNAMLAILTGADIDGNEK